MGKSEEIRRPGADGTSVSWTETGITVVNPDPTREFTAFEAIAFAGAILAAAAELMEFAEPEVLDA